MDIDDLFDCFNQVTKIEVAKDSQGSKRPRNDTPDETESPKKAKLDSEDLEQFKQILSEELKNRVVVYSLDTIDSCSHEVAYPSKQAAVPLVASQGEPAKKYKFVLDPFQKESILCIENNQSVLVSAHTSAGKTVIAEYAIALCLKNKQRVIYTSPIKALSNQKYREFNDEFKDVGLMTGDVTINPTASCLIMTTEILRNMLYKGSDVIREVAWIIFDEIHYMRDKSRGVVWEETLIMLPHNARFVFLSATIPNAKQFIQWISHIHQQTCHVVYTDYRPTPLQHYLFPAGGSGIHMVVDENGTFQEDNFNGAMTELQNAGEAAKGDQKGRKGGVRNKDATQTDIYKMVKMTVERNFAPVIVFSFSKKDCELYAKQMTKMDFNTTSEKLAVDEIFNNAIQVLSEEDQDLPYIKHMIPLLRRGIGIHHGGLLPVIKETVEILFGEGLIKVLFATETFAMGLNMPARTVIFTDMRKFDGQKHRWVTSGEYIQMAGRAGRRGLDDKGIVISMINEKVPSAACRSIIKGLPDPLNSAFHLTYNMVLNLLRVEVIDPDYMLEKSFFQFQNQTEIPRLFDDYEAKLEKYNEFEIENEPEVESYHVLKQQLETLYIQTRKFMLEPKVLGRFLKNGRVMKVSTPEGEYDWGIVVGCKWLKNGKKKDKKVEIDMLLNVIQDDESDSNKPALLEDKDGQMEIIPVDSSYVTHISSGRCNFSGDWKSKEIKKMIKPWLRKLKEDHPDGIPLLDPVKDMKINDPSLTDIMDQIAKIQDKIKKHPFAKHPSMKEIYKKYKEKINCQSELEEVRIKLLDAKKIIQMDELKCRKRVLRRLDYCTKEDVIELKGRVACELSSADELLLTELLFNGVFNNLTPAEATALLSCFVCTEKSDKPPKIRESLNGPFRQMQDIARRIAKVNAECRLTVDEETYVQSFRPFLMDIVYRWCNGASFRDLLDPDIYEGSVIRCMRRLEELLRQMVQASKVIGNHELEDKFEDGIKMIKRDIIFAASLYL
ncbi:exosome RNA helicase MTR4-like [Coccinella septempunctata]|uniref:exosome RNA helicase MTR4-like n=1 Tax=Coccinella septempunctata TaxID=41139 RepID=UPI001D09725D|nr:exosome RNA helicase MTR4-like [Coccinella septempunctata]